MNVCALIPCHNEADRISGVIKPLIDSKYIDQIVVVDDASCDNSLEVIKKFKEVKAIRLSKNKGKGGAVREGLKHIKTDTVLLLDADLIGLKKTHIKNMVKTYAQSPGCLLVGLTDKKNAITNKLREELLPLISGQRILRKKDLEKVLKCSLSSEYGIEPYMNYYFKIRKKPIKKVLLEGVNDIPKYKKTKHGIKPYILESANIASKYFSVYMKIFPRDVKKEIENLFRPQEFQAKIKLSPKSVLAGGIKINYVKTGKGKPIVLVHGWTSDWENWSEVVPYLRNFYTLYLLDLPGFGASQDLEKYSIVKVGDIVASFAKSIKREPCALVGTSLGSCVVAEAEYRHPNCAKSFILCGLPIRRGKKRIGYKSVKYSLWVLHKLPFGDSVIRKLVESRLLSYLVSKYINAEKFSRLYVDYYGKVAKKRMRMKAFVEMGISLADCKPEKILLKCKKPTLLLYGKKDKVSDSKIAKEKIVPKNKNLVFREIPNSGHIIHLESPKEVAYEIRRFLKSIGI